MREPFDNIVKLHGPIVARVCRMILGPGHDADDAWAETFLAVFRAWPGLDDDTNVKGLLFRTAQRKAIDSLRATARRATPMDTVPEIAAVADLGEDSLSEFWEPVRRLPERQRLAVAYHYFAGLSYSDTAALIGGTTDAVRRAAADGIHSLRRTLGVGDDSEARAGR